MSLVSVYKKIYVQALSVFFVFVITFIVFPGVSNAEGTKLSFCNGSWSFVLMVTFFNIFDTCGRFTPNVFMPFKNRRSLVAILSGLR